MVKAGQVTNPTHGKYDLPANAPYSPYSANSGDEEEGKSKDGKGSKRDVEHAYVTCSHSFVGGTGRYLCDPEHLYHEEEGGLA